MSYYSHYSQLLTAYEDILIDSGMYILPLPWTMLYILN